MIPMKGIEDNSVKEHHNSFVFGDILVELETSN
jgi:hypothetical protein